MLRRAARLHGDSTLHIPSLGCPTSPMMRGGEALQRAQEFARRAIALDPELAEAHMALGNTYAYVYDYAHAVEEHREAIRRSPQDYLIWDQLSWALGYKQPPEAVEAEKAAREAIRLQPARASAWYHLGRALIFQERYQEATAAFQHCRELSGGVDVDFENLGMAQLSLAQGNYDQAIAYMQKYKALNNAIGQYWLSASYAGKGDKQKALAALQKSFDQGFRDFAAIDAAPYFSSLRTDPRFQQMVRRYRK